MDPLVESLTWKRKQLRMSREDVGRKVGVSGAAVATWERSERDVPLSKLRKWATALGVTFIVTEIRGDL